MADASVRPAVPEDSVAIGRMQAQVWRAAYDGLLPATALAELADAAALGRRWREAVTNPPSRQHRVLVAVADDAVVGVATAAPAEDELAAAAAPAEDELDVPEALPSAELLTLLVDPSAQRAGHGSRLLAAITELLRGDGVRRVTAWVDASDRTGDPLRSLLEATGWAPDGARRRLDLYGDGAVVVPQLGLHTDLGE